MRSSALVLLCLLASFAFGQNPALVISPLTGDFFVYTTYQTYQGTPFPANSLYLVTDAGVVLIDTPWDSTQFQPLLDSIQARHHQPAVMCIATHSHADRTAGLDYYRSQGIKTYTTRMTDSICLARNEHRAEYVLNGDTTFTVGKYTFQTFYPGPGHTPDNIVVWFPNDRILHGGCFIKSTEANTLGNLADANVPAWEPSLRKVEQQFGHPAHVIPGHQSWKKTASIAHTRRLVRAYLRKNG